MLLLCLLCSSQRTARSDRTPRLSPHVQRAGRVRGEHHMPYRAPVRCTKCGRREGFRPHQAHEARLAACTPERHRHIAALECICAAVDCGECASGRGHRSLSTIGVQAIHGSSLRVDQFEAACLNSARVSCEMPGCRSESGCSHALVGRVRGEDGNLVLGSVHELLDWFGRCSSPCSLLVRAWVST